MDADPALIRPVTAEEVRPLRHRVLRPGEGYDKTAYAGDLAAGSVHFGAFAGDRLVGIASLYREGRDGGPGWRLRGMATDADVRGTGFGAALLAACVGHVGAMGGGELWCNARLAAVGFYKRAGLEVVSDEFDLPGFGLHVIMAVMVPAA